MRLIEVLERIPKSRKIDDALENAHQIMKLNLWFEIKPHTQEYRNQLQIVRMIEDELDIPSWLREAY